MGRGPGGVNPSGSIPVLGQPLRHFLGDIDGLPASLVVVHAEVDDGQEEFFAGEVFDGYAAELEAGEVGEEFFGVDGAEKVVHGSILCSDSILR